MQMIDKPEGLTDHQLWVLEQLASGALLVFDEHNCAWILASGERTQMIQHQTRLSLTANRLVERADKSRDIKAAGNGFTISTKGRKLLGSAYATSRC